MKYFSIILFLFLILTACPSFALDIVYPKTNPVKINAESTFFIGSTIPNSVLKINDVDVKVSPLGAFAQIVHLNFGLNYFKIQSVDSEINFTIERPQVIFQNCAQTLIEYPVMNNFYVKADNAPLRMNPVDAGINRMAHLPKDTQLLINGEKGDFYRVYLNSTLTGWISKSNVEQRNIEQLANTPVKMLNFTSKENSGYYIYEFDFGGELLPFSLKGENGLTLQIFNVEGQPDNTFFLNIPITKPMGYDIYNRDNKLILKVRKTPNISSEKPLKDLIIAVDAGHGGSEFGAIGCCGDKEKDINLAIAKNLKDVLKARGAKVIMTRDEDKDVSLQDRVKIAKENDSLLLVSIHANALPDGQDPNKNKGTSVYYYHNQAKLLADCILTTMNTQLGTQNDKVRQGSLALVRTTSSVSVLIEVAYIINPDDYAMLLDKNFQQNCAKAIADGIEKYLLQN